MKTTSKDKIKKAQRLAEVIELRKQIEKEESELKGFFKDEITDGVLEAGAVIIQIEQKTRESLDREGLEKELGAKLIKFVKVTEYKQVSVTKKSA
jgi:hypothetical protein